VWVPEAARAWAEAKGAPLGYEDVEPIARGHLAAAREADSRAKRLVFLDTDLISTIVYSRHYYGDCPAWIERTARDRRADLYLLLHPDVPWVPDPSRDRGHLREPMHRLFRDALGEFKVRWVEVEGGWEERQSRAREDVDALLRDSVPGRSDR
jgi:nicotinamide riboside kinase